MSQLVSLQDEVSSIDFQFFTDFLLVHLIAGLSLVWKDEGGIVPLSLQNINRCFLELVISHRDL